MKGHGNKYIKNIVNIPLSIFGILQQTIKEFYTDTLYVYALIDTCI